MGMRETDPVETFDAVCTKETDRALLVVIDGEEYWIPKTHVHADSEVFDDSSNAEGKLIISQWIAKQKNLA